MSTVLVYCDDAELRRAVLAAAQGLGDVRLATKEALGLPDEDSMTVAAGLAEAAKACNADLVLVGATKKGKDVGPRTAAHLDRPFAAEALAIEKGEGGWRASRMVLSGNSQATYTMGDKAVCTVVPGAFEDPGSEPDAPTADAVQVDASPVKVTGTKGDSDSTFDLGGADVVVGVGRGFKAKEDLKLAEGLAACFKGGAVGCSRPIAADLKWLGEEHWIGLSGHEIRPKAYFAVGVSGQIQHVAGIRGSKLIIAVNTNKDAPITQVSDYVVIGDLYKVLPKLTEALKK